MKIICVLAAIGIAVSANAVNRSFCRVAEGGKSVVYAPEMLAPVLAPPTAAEYLAAGWLKNGILPPSPSEGMMATNTTYEARGEAVIAVYDYAPIPPRVRRWTPLSIKRSAVKLGCWDALKSLLTAANAYDDFIMAQYEAEDDADFVRLMAAARQQLGDEVVDAVLNGAEEE